MHQFYLLLEENFNVPFLEIHNQDDSPKYI